MQKARPSRLGRRVHPRGRGRGRGATARPGSAELGGHRYRRWRPRRRGWAGGREWFRGPAEEDAGAEKEGKMRFEMVAWGDEDRQRASVFFLFLFMCPPLSSLPPYHTSSGRSSKPASGWSAARAWWSSARAWSRRSRASAMVVVALHPKRRDRPSKNASAGSLDTHETPTRATPHTRARARTRTGASGWPGRLSGCVAAFVCVC